MIAHKKDAGVIRTQPTNSAVFECQQCGTTWTDKRDLWQDCVSMPEEATEKQKVHANAVAVSAAVVKRDPNLPREGSVVEK